MKKIYEINVESIRINSPFPIIYLLEMEITHMGNDHGKIMIKAVIDEKKEEVLRKYWCGEKISVEKNDGEGEILFQGTIESFICKKENRFLVVEVVGVGGTILLDREKKTRSYQNLNLTYKQVVKNIIKDLNNSSFIWGEYEDRLLREPLLQYRETDWEFLKRLCSHFHGRVFPDLKTGKPNFYFGLSKGKERSTDVAEIIERGFEGDYYQNGCWENGFPRSYGFYLKVQTKESWQIGDFLIYEGQSYYVHERRIVFNNGEIIFTYILGTKGMCFEKKKYNEFLIGEQLSGIIRKVEGESVYLQLDIDEEEQAGYPWEWLPETNNICYCMPEVGAKAMLVFPSKKEKLGYAMSCIWERSKYMNPSNREFITKWKKRVGLYPSRMFLEGEEGEQEIILEDLSGVFLKSNKKLSAFAQKDIYLKGKRILVAAYQEAVYQTIYSNIELCRDINLYAQKGVRMVGTGNVARMKIEDKQKRKKIEQWQVACMALAATPIVRLEKDIKVDVVDIFTLGSIPRIASGFLTIDISEVMEGKKENECSFPKALQSMNIYTVKGGYALPQDKSMKNVYI